MLHTTPSTVVTLVADEVNPVTITVLRLVILGNLPFRLLGANIVKVSVSHL